MKNLFVPYEIAVLAKEKGFNDSCFGFFSLDDNQKPIVIKMFGAVNVGFVLSSPLYQQLIDWVREKHNIFIMIYPQDGWCYMYQDMSELPNVGNVSNGHGTKFITYYEALNQALQEAFKLI